MDKKYIDCEELLKTHPFTRCGGPLTDYAEGYLDCVEDAKEVINQFPSADVMEVRHGKWGEYDKYICSSDDKPVAKIGVIYVCSECGREEPHKEPYCHCGAKMDKGDD